MKMKTTLLLLLLAISNSNFAAIVHQNVNATVSFDPGGFMGTYDLTINGTVIGCGYNGTSGIWFGDNNFSNSIVVTELGTPADRLKIFTAGQLVDGTWQVNLDGFTSYNEPTIGSETAGIRYIGLKTIANNFVWVKINVIPGVSYQIMEYAYETNANTGIMAGNAGTASLDEISVENFNIVQNENLMTVYSEFDAPIVMLTDLNGAKIMDITVNESNDISALKNGLYLVVMENKKRFYSKKVWLN